LITYIEKLIKSLLLKSNKMVNEEYIMKLAAIEQEMNRLEQQMQIIEQQILEMQALQFGLQELDKSKEKQMFANLGKNIFIKTEIKDKNLLVDVGNKTFVKKNISETLKVIEGQMNKLAEVKNQILGKMQEIQMQTEMVIKEAEKSNKK